MGTTESTMAIASGAKAGTRIGPATPASAREQTASEHKTTFLSLHNNRTTTTSTILPRYNNYNHPTPTTNPLPRDHRPPLGSEMNENRHIVAVACITIETGL